MQTIKFWRKNVIFLMTVLFSCISSFQLGVAAETALVQKFKIQTFASVELFYKRKGDFCLFIEQWFKFQMLLY